MKGTKEQIFNAGFNDFLIKPITQKDIIKKLLGYIDSTKIELEPRHQTSQKDDEVKWMRKKLPRFKKNANELEKILNDQLLAEWAIVKKGFILNKIELFADKVLAISREYQIDILDQWAKDIKKQSANFDMEKLPATMKRFPELANQILSQINK